MDASRTESRKRELAALLRRDHTLYGGVLLGIDGYIIEIQARAVEVLRQPGAWRGAVTISGMAHGAISEAIDRIAGAFSKLEIPNPEVEILINLAPADLPKEGTWLDLPLAIIMLQAAGLLPDLDMSFEGKVVLMGEISLHGEIRRVPGVLSVACICKAGQALIVPAGNEKECALIMAAPGHEGCKICPVSTLKEVVDYFAGVGKLENALKQEIKFEEFIPKRPEFTTVKGQVRAKEAALIAAAGGHNLLLIGPPGEGKSLLASALPGILPQLSNEEIIDLTRIYSACGLLEKDGLAVTRRPMRSIHHTASEQALVGGGSKIPRPGEITLAHLGVLFMDEISQFSQSALDSLRQPIEDGKIRISRVGGSFEYPCRFTLVAAMNPCPCGYFGTDQCRCKESEIHKYQSKISGPILDRIDLQVELARLTTEERFEEPEGEGTHALRTRVQLARERQNVRFAGAEIPFNAAIPAGSIKEFCVFSNDGFERYKQTVERNTLTTRSVDRLAKVARTVADLSDSAQVLPDHVDKASSFVIGGMLRSLF